MAMLQAFDLITSPFTWILSSLPQVFVHVMNLLEHREFQHTNVVVSSLMISYKQMFLLFMLLAKSLCIVVLFMVLLCLVMIWLKLSQIIWPQVEKNDSWVEICHVNLNFWEFMLPVLVIISLKMTR